MLLESQSPLRGIESPQNADGEHSEPNRQRGDDDDSKIGGLLLSMWRTLGTDSGTEGYNGGSS